MMTAIIWMTTCSDYSNIKGNGKGWRQQKQLNSILMDKKTDRYRLVWATDSWQLCTVAGSYPTVLGSFFISQKYWHTNSNVYRRIFMTIAGSYILQSW